MLIDPYLKVEIFSSVIHQAQRQLLKIPAQGIDNTPIGYYNGYIKENKATFDLTFGLLSQTDNSQGKEEEK